MLKKIQKIMESKPPILSKIVSNRAQYEKPKFLQDIDVCVSQFRGDTSFSQRKMKKALSERRDSQ